MTPERISKSKMFVSKLEKAHTQRRVTAFVVDEAHCCSQVHTSLLNSYLKRTPIGAVALTFLASSTVLSIRNEMMSKSKMFLSRSERAHTQGRVTAFVVDEARCCSQVHSRKPFLKSILVEDSHAYTRSGGSPLWSSTRLIAAHRFIQPNVRFKSVFVDSHRRCGRTGRFTGKLCSVPNAFESLNPLQNGAFGV